MATKLLTSTWQPENFYRAALTADLSAGGLDIFLDIVPANSEGVLVIDYESAANREIIYYNSKTATKVTCPANGRGYDNSTATSHTTGTTVVMAPTADWFNSIKSGQVFDSTAVLVASNPYKFSAYRTSAWTAATNAWGKVTPDTEDFDTNNNFASGTYTAPIAGFYFFEGTVGSSQNNGASPLAALYKNGSEVKRGTGAANMGLTGSAVVQTSVSSLLQLAANDTVELYHFGNAGAGATGALTHFSGFLVSKT